MKKLAAAFAPLLVFFSPAVAMACPGSSESCRACGSHSYGYATAIGIGLVLGMGSIAFERVLKKK